MKGKAGERALLRLCEVVRQRLGAEQARLEIGGSPPAGDLFVSVEVPASSFRMVAVFAEPPADREAKIARLAAMAEGFAGVIGSTLAGDGERQEPAYASPSTSLDEALAQLAQATSALSVVVVDSASPVLWGRSHAELEIAPREEGAAALTRLGRWLDAAGGDWASWLAAEHDARIVKLSAALDTRDQRDEALLDELSRRPDAFHSVALCARTVAQVRRELSLRLQTARLPLPRLVEHGQAQSIFARGLADVYALALTFAGPMAEPRVDGAVRRIAAHLERLVESIPPLDPTPITKGARVVTLRRR